jgi:hypothetical protein
MSCCSSHNLRIPVLDSEERKMFSNESLQILILGDTVPNLLSDGFTRMSDSKIPK